MRNEADRALDDLAGTPVVDLEVDSAKARQDRIQAEDPADIGQPPAIDGLVVVADQEDAVGRRGQQQGESKLGTVDVLDLIDQQFATACAPAGQQPVVPLESFDGPQDEVVEVEPTTGRYLGVVGDERGRHRSGLGVRRDVCRRHAKFHLEP